METTTEITNGAPIISADIAGSTFSNMDGSKKLARKDGPKRIYKRYSGFFYVWNTNKSFYDPNDPEFKDTVSKLQAVFADVLKAENIAKYIKFKDPEHSFTSKYFDEVKVRALPEVGDDQHRLHVNFYLYFAHRSTVLIDYHILKYMIDETCRQHGLNFTGTAMKPSPPGRNKDVWREFDEYMNKDA